MRDVVIVAAKRTPIGAMMGGLSSLPAYELGRRAIEAVMDQAALASDEVDQVILGQVLVAGQGQNPARQAAFTAGLAVETPAWGVSQVCGSGLLAVANGMQAVALGDADIVIAGGQESMSCALHAFYGRAGQEMGAVQTVDTLIEDGLTDAFYGHHMGITAENVADCYRIGRAAQDAFAARSHNLAEQADAEGCFADEIVPVHLDSGEKVLVRDESIRSGVSQEKLMQLRPVFDRYGTVSAGNSSPLNDGAAALVLMSRETAERRGLAALARIAGWATAGVDPRFMGIGPVSATRKALAKAGWSIDQVDLFEANEAFAAQSLAVVGELEVPSERVNVLGGAIALGHPIGASGARVLTTLVYNLARRRLSKGLATLCIGGGMGIAMCIER